MNNIKKSKINFGFTRETVRLRDLVTYDLESIKEEIDFQSKRSKESSIVHSKKMLQIPLIQIDEINKSVSKGKGLIMIKD